MSRLIRVARDFALVSLALLVSSAIWSFWISERKHRDNPPPGEFFTVTGSPLHIQCTGEGSPAVVFESAASAPWSEWRLVRPQLSRVTRVCSYDRPGHGWSPPRSGRRDAETIARELHALLDRAGVPRPIVLGGHSAGGLYVREYSHEYPEEIAGAVLIDSSSPRQLDELPGFRASYEQDKRDALLETWKDRIRVWSGWERFMGHCAVQPSKTIRGEWIAQYEAMACRPEFVDTDEIELAYFEDSSIQAGHLRSFGDAPLLVISRDIGFHPEQESVNERAELKMWEREQEESKALSRKSWRIIAGRSGHMVPLDRPDVVSREIARLVSYLRGGETPLFGTTTRAAQD